LLHAAFLSHCPRYNSCRIAATHTFSFSHISFFPGEMAGHVVYPTYPHLYEFDYEYGAMPRLPLPLGMGLERFFFFSAVMGKAGEYKWVAFRFLHLSFELLFYLKHFQIRYRHSLTWIPPRAAPLFAKLAAEFALLATARAALEMLVLESVRFLQRQPQQQQQQQPLGLVKECCCRRKCDRVHFWLV
jgi:hypothetical protein